MPTFSWKTWVWTKPAVCQPRAERTSARGSTSSAMACQVSRVGSQSKVSPVSGTVDRVSRAPTEGTVHEAGE